jgi:chromosome segregation ATPase
MIQKKIEGQGPAEWIERKKIIERQIGDINKKLNSMPNVQSLVIAAGDAKARVESFIYLNGGSEGQTPENKQGQLQKLKEDVEKTANVAKSTKQQYKQIISEKADLKKELAGLQRLNHPKSFSIEGLREFVLKAVKPLIEIIKATEAKLRKLEANRDKFKAELDNCDCKSKALDENALMDISVEDYALELKNIEQLEGKQKAVEDLLGRTELAIEAKKKQLESEKKEFADDLTAAVDAYTYGGMLKIARELKSILEEDEKYHKYTTELCHKLLSEIGAAPIDVFGFTGGSLPVKTHLFYPIDLKEKVDAMVENIFKQQAE